MRKLTFTNSKGATITFERDGSFLFNNITGLGEVAAELQMQKSPYQNGATLIDVVLGTRAISFEFTIRGEGDDDISAKRELLSSVFNPLNGEGLLTYQYGTRVRQINVAIDHVPTFPSGRENRSEWKQRGIINLTASKPYWEETNPINVKLEDFVGSFRFPFTLPTRFSTRGDSKVLANYGDVPSPIEVEFRGPVINPTLTNQSTGEFIRVNQEIPMGYKLILDTSFGNKRVDIVAPDGTTTNGFHYIDLQSTFFSLDVGDTRIGFVAESGSPEVYVRYKQRYLSV